MLEGCRYKLEIAVGGLHKDTVRRVGKAKIKTNVISDFLSICAFFRKPRVRKERIRILHPIETFLITVHISPVGLVEWLETEEDFICLRFTNLPGVGFTLCKEFNT